MGPSFSIALADMAIRVLAAVSPIFPLPTTADREEACEVIVGLLAQETTTPTS
jgi:hypothetical protein